MGFKTGQRISFRPPGREPKFGTYNEATVDGDGDGLEHWMTFDNERNPRFTAFAKYIFPEPEIPYDHDLGEIG